jgi:hypothetical protein
MASTDINVPVAKAKGFLPVTKEDIDALPDVSYREIMTQGLKAVMARGQSKISADTYPDEQERRAAAMAAAQKNWEDCKQGTIRVTGGKGKVAGKGAYNVEARRLARQAVKDAIKESGGKISHYEASEITRAANDLIETDPTIMELAIKNVDDRKAKPVKSDIMSIIKISDKKVAAANAKAASKKVSTGQLSIKQAGLVAKVRPAPHA